MRWQRDIGVSGGMWAEVVGGTSLFIQDPSCQELPTSYEMLGNVTLQTDVPQLHVHGNSEVWLLTLYTVRQEMKRGGLRNHRHYRCNEN